MFRIPSSHFRSGCLTAHISESVAASSIGRTSTGFPRTSTSELSHPSLTFSTEILFEQAQRHQIPYSLYDGNPMTIGVINALVRLVHGGRGMEDSKQFTDPKTFNKSFMELLKQKEPPKYRRNINVSDRCSRANSIRARIQFDFQQRF